MGECKCNAGSKTGSHGTDLGIARGRDQVQPGQGGKSKQDEGTAASSVEAGISTQKKANQGGADRQLAGGKSVHFVFFSQIFVCQDKNRYKRKDYDHDDLQIFCRKDQVQSGSKDGTDDGIDPGNDSCKTVNMSAFYKFEKRGETSQKTGALIGPCDQMYGKSGKHKGGQSEKPAASGYGVNDSGKEECYAYDYKRRHVQFHGRLP